MPRMPPRRLPLCFLAAAFAAAGGGCASAAGPEQSERGAAGEEVTILRDAYGVPHVFAHSEEAGVYGLGYAQAEDRLAAILRNIKQARGELAEIDGPEALPGDVQVRAFRLLEHARDHYATISAPARRDIKAF